MIITQSKTKKEAEVRRYPTLSLSIPTTTERVFSIISPTCTTLQITRSESSKLSTALPRPPIKPTPILERTTITKPSKPTSPIREPCFQCLHLGLRCSFTSTRQHSRGNNKKQRFCSRCSRNGEGFCILQDAEMGPGGKVVQVKYEADGVERGVVLERVRELEEEQWSKWKWALPFASRERRQALRPVVGDRSQVFADEQWRETRSAQEFAGVVAEDI